MATITLRSVKGSALTNAEVDANFTNLNNDKIEASALAPYLTSASAASTYQPLDGDLTSIAGLAGTSGFLKKTAANTWALDTNTYLTGNQTITLSGDASGSGATAISVTLANSGVVANTYTKVTVDAKGRVTSGASLASADLPTYTGTLTSLQVTTALGFTPYNSTNPSGYITSSSLSSYLPLAGGTVTGALTVSNTTASTSTTTGALIVSGGLGVAGRINVGDYITRVTGSGNSSWLQQDGTGRVHWYWNTYGGTSPTHTVGSEDASAITLHINNNGGGGSFFHRSASGVGKNAGDAVSWTTTLYSDLNTISWKGNTIWHAGNLASPSTSATGNTLAQRTADAYLYASYYNMTAGQQNLTATDYIYTQGDGFFRKKALADVRAEIVTNASVVAAAFSGSYGSTNLNTTTTGFWHAADSYSNVPNASNYFHRWDYVHVANTWVAQFATPSSGPMDYWMRRQENGTWTGWAKFWNSVNDGSGSGLDADLLDGYHVSSLLTFIGQSGSLNDLPIRTHNEASYPSDSTSSLPVSPGGTNQWWNTLTIGADARRTQISAQAFGTGAGNAPQSDIWIRSKHDSNWGAWKRILTTNNMPGSTLDATTLVTNLNADLLDGYHASAAITGNTIAQRTADGYLFATFFNSNQGDDTSGATHYIFMGYGGDGYYRRKPIASVRTEIVTNAAVTSGLGYTPVNKAGDTVTGALNVRYSSGNGISGPLSGTWASTVVMHTDSAGYNGLAVMSRWGGSGATIFEVATGWNGGIASYNPVLSITGDGDFKIKARNGQATLFGIAPDNGIITVYSSNLVTNLNADYLDNYHASAFALLNTTPTFTGLSFGTNNPHVRLRHLDGKAPSSDTIDHLYLQYGIGSYDVNIGGGGTTSNLRMLNGNIYPFNSNGSYIGGDGSGGVLVGGGYWYVPTGTFFVQNRIQARGGISNDAGDFILHAGGSNRFYMQGDNPELILYHNAAGSSANARKGRIQQLNGEMHIAIVNDIVDNFFSWGVKLNNAVFYPTLTNNLYLGGSSNRWITVFSVNGMDASSDINMKKDIQTTRLGLDFVNRIDPVSYRWKDGDGRVRHGVIAQQLREVVDEFGAEFGDLADDCKSLNYSGLLAPIIKAVQELSSQVREIKEKVNA